jgi:hypothetical protein
MAKKYRRLLEDRLINEDTNSVWAIQDVPPLWQKKTEQLVISEGYYFDEDGTAYPVPPNEE